MNGAGAGRSRVAVAGVACSLLGCVVAFAAGFGYRHGWWGLGVAFGRRVLGVPHVGLLPIGALLALAGGAVSLVAPSAALRTPARGARRPHPGPVGAGPPLRVV